MKPLWAKTLFVPKGSHSPYGTKVSSRDIHNANRRLQKYGVMLNGTVIQDATPIEALSHSLIHHCLDVGAVTSVLLSVEGEKTQNWLMDGFGFSDWAECLRSLTWLACAHDIGKATPQFNSKVPWLADPLSTEGMELLIHKVDGKDDRNLELQHGAATSQILRDRLIKTPDLNTYVGGHHGVKISKTEMLDCNWWDAPLAGRRALTSARYKKCVADWKARQNAVLDQITSVIGDFLPPQEEEPQQTRFFAGLLSFADWIGSNVCHMCPDVPSDDDGEYFRMATIRAQEVVGALQVGPVKLDRVRDIAVLEAMLAIPSGGLTPTQSAMWMVATSEVNVGQLIIIEDQTGSGKTEAALAAFLAHPGRGLAFCLPTCATANSMYERIRAFCDRCGLPPPVIAHSGITKPDGIAEDWTVDDLDDFDMLSWVSGPRKPLVCPIGVFTVDQAMAAAIRGKHFFTRLYGLAGKTLIIDEVHAYDAYMQRIIVRLIGLHIKMGGRVILCSATLPTSTRKYLMESVYDAIREDKNGPAYEVKPAAYPSINWIGGGVSLAGRRPEKECAFVMVKEDDGIDAALKSYYDGGCSVIVCNTVQKCQDVYNKLDIPKEDKIALHSRIISRERSRRENLIISRYGKNGTRERSIVIATQIVEQSLDVDFDTGVSYLAPIDLLIQRLGRVHRHRENPRPVLKVIDEAFSIYEELIVDLTRGLIEKGYAFTVPGDTQRMTDACYPDTDASDGPVPLNWTRSENEYFIKLAKLRVKIEESRKNTGLVEYDFNQPETSVWSGMNDGAVFPEEYSDMPTRDSDFGGLLIIADDPSATLSDDNMLPIPKSIKELLAPNGSPDGVNVFSAAHKLGRRFEKALVIGKQPFVVNNHHVSYCTETGLRVTELPS